MGASSAYRTVHLVSDDVILWSHRMNHTRIVHVHVYGLRSNATLFLHCIVHSYFTIGVLYAVHIVQCALCTAALVLLVLYCEFGINMIYERLKTKERRHANRVNTANTHTPKATEPRMEGRGNFHTSAHYWRLAMPVGATLYSYSMHRCAVQKNVFRFIFR